MLVGGERLWLTHGSTGSLSVEISQQMIGIVLLRLYAERESAAESIIIGESFVEKCHGGYVRKSTHKALQSIFRPVIGKALNAILLCTLHQVVVLSRFCETGGPFWVDIECPA
jgi:hypothetical protein